MRKYSTACKNMLFLALRPFISLECNTTHFFLSSEKKILFSYCAHWCSIFVFSSPFILGKYFPKLYKLGNDNRELYLELSTCSMIGNLSETFLVLVENFFPHQNHLVSIFLLSVNIVYFDYKKRK